MLANVRAARGGILGILCCTSESESARLTRNCQCATSAPIRIKARAFAAWKPLASARRLFDEAVARAEAAIDARINALVYEHAERAFTIL